MFGIVGVESVYIFHPGYRLYRYSIYYCKRRAKRRLIQIVLSSSSMLTIYFIVIDSYENELRSISSFSLNEAHSMTHIKGYQNDLIVWTYCRFFERVYE